MSSPLTTIVPPCVPLCLPAAASVPEILMVWVGAPAGLLPPVAALSTIMPLWRPIELALITPLVLMTESTTARAAAAVSSTRPPLALSVPLLVLLTSDLSGRPVATSMTFVGDAVADRERDQLVAVHVEREAVAGCQRDRAERRGDGAGVAHAGRDQRGKAAARRRDPPLIDDRGIRPARDVEIVPPRHEVGVLDVVGGGEEARGVHHAAGPEQDAVAVDDEDAAVGGQRAHDLRRPEAADHAVERDRRAARLIEAHALVGADIERVPVDDRAGGRLVDDHRRAALALDRGRAADHRRRLRARPQPAPAPNAMSAVVASTRLRKRGCIAKDPNYGASNPLFL